MIRVMLVVAALLLSGCAVDRTPYDRGRILGSSDLHASRMPAANVEVEWASNGLIPFMGKIQDMSVHARPVVAEALADAGVQAVPSGAPLTVKVTIAPNSTPLVAGWSYPFWKNFGMNMAFVGLFREYYDVYTTYTANFQVMDKGRVVYDKNFSRDVKVAYNLGEWNFGRHKILTDRARELFLAELTRSTLDFAADYQQRGPVAMLSN